MQAIQNTSAPVAEPAPPMDPRWIAWLQFLFSYDMLHVRQRIRPFTQKYQVTNAEGHTLFHVVRPPRLAIGMTVSLFVTVLNLMILITVFRFIMGGGSFVLGLGILFTSNFVLGLLHALMAPYRDIEVFTDESESWRILTITQDNKIAIWREYTLYDCLGGEVARFRRSTFQSVLRRHWRVETPDGKLIYRVREDSLVRSLLRRYLGPLYGALRTNFNFELEDGQVIGHYDRKFTLTDQYLLDLRADQRRVADRRTTLAMAILLDTAESR